MHLSARSVTGLNVYQIVYISLSISSMINEYVATHVLRSCATEYMHPVEAYNRDVEVHLDTDFLYHSATMCCYARP